MPTTQLAPAAKVAPQVFEAMAKSAGFVPVNENPENVIAVVPLFVMVVVFVALVCPTTVRVKASEAGTSETSVPTPVSATFCGLLVALSVKLRVPVRVPIAVGVNVTLTVHEPFTATVAPQVVALLAKSPVTPMLLIFSVAVPVLVSVTVFAAVVVFSNFVPKLREVADSLTTGLPALAPVPDNAAVCVPPGASSFTTRVPFWAPVAVGANVTLMVHVPPGATTAPGRVPQVCDETANGAAVLMLLIVKLPDWLLVS